MKNRITMLPVFAIYVTRYGNMAQFRHISMISSHEPKNCPFPATTILQSPDEPFSLSYLNDNFFLFPATPPTVYDIFETQPSERNGITIIMTIYHTGNVPSKDLHVCMLSKFEDYKTHLTV